MQGELLVARFHSSFAFSESPKNLAKSEHGVVCIINKRKGARGGGGAGGRWSRGRRSRGGYRPAPDRYTSDLLLLFNYLHLTLSGGRKSVVSLAQYGHSSVARSLAHHLILSPFIDTPHSPDYANNYYFSLLHVLYFFLFFFIQAYNRKIVKSSFSR